MYIEIVMNSSVVSIMNAIMIENSDTVRYSNNSIKY